MNETNLDQAIAFAKMLACGFAVGFCYDFSASLMRVSDERRGFSDTFFWLVTCVLCAFALFYATQMQLRLYLMLGVIAGWGLYFLLLSPVMRFFLGPLRTLVGTFIRALAGIGALAKKKTKRLLALPASVLKRYNKYRKYMSAGVFRVRKKSKETPDL